MTRKPPSRLHADAVPDEVKAVLRRLGEAGHRSWLVGGVVRDLLLSRVRHDPEEFDLATPATPEQVQELFRKVIPTGIEHGTVTVLEGGARVEVTTFRGEAEYVDGRRPSRVTFHGDLEADLGRRDFTMNAMAWDPLAGELRDPFGGQVDLSRKRIRAVGDARERFGEDGLRPLRAVRFVSQLGFSLAPATRRAIPASLAVVAQVSRERVAEELSRLLVGAHAPEGIEALAATGLLPIVLPRLGSMPAERVRHALAVAAEPFPPCGGKEEGDRDRCRLLRLAGLLHVLPPGEALQSVVEMRLPNRVATAVAALIGARNGPDHGSLPGLEGDGIEVRRFLSETGREHLPLLLDLWTADARHQGPRSFRRVAEVARLRSRAAAELKRNPPLAVSDLAIGGRDAMEILGSPGGKEVGEGLRHLLDAALTDPAVNTRAGLSEHLRDWWRRRQGKTPESAGS
jgi:tRNA nucleotidyltransferase (CCA-adding enzyme)